MVEVGRLVKDYLNQLTLDETNSVTEQRKMISLCGKPLNTEHSKNLLIALNSVLSIVAPYEMYIVMYTS
jgi:hypothetical protein